MSGTKDISAPPVSHIGCRVLVVDDDRDFAGSLTQLLRLEGCKADFVNSLVDARAYLGGTHTDIALIDIRLGNRDGDNSGLVLVAEIKKSKVPVTCIMMTAYASVETAVATLKEGAYDYLRKPFDSEDLLAVIDRCCERRALIYEREQAEIALRSRNRDLEVLNVRLQGLVGSMQRLSTCTDLAGLSQCLLEQVIGLTTSVGGKIELDSGERATVGLENMRESLATNQIHEFPMLSSESVPIGTVTIFPNAERQITGESQELVQILVSYASEAVHLLQALDRVSWSELRLRDIIDHSPSLISLQDLAGRFLIVNKRFEEWHGLTSQEVVGHTAVDVLAPEEASLFLTGHDGTSGHGRWRDDEIDVWLADGMKHTLLTTRFPVHAGEGGLIGVGTIATDVSKRRQAEEHLRQAQKMEALGLLTGGIAHDFNNLLAVIYGNLSLVTSEISGDGDLKEMIDDAAAAAQAGADLTHRLLTFGRQQALHTQPTDLSELLGPFSRVLERTLGEAVQIELILDHDLWAVAIDSGHLETSILNLALNARDAMPEGGCLTIKASNHVSTDSHDTPVTGRGRGEFVEIAVSDTGSGMTPEVQARAVQPFFTTKGPDRGSGLGLSMVYGFAEQSGGDLQIESVPKQGTTIRLRLPRASVGQLKEKNRPDSVITDASNSGAILLVEDQAAVRRLVSRILTKAGFDVLEAGDGPTALQILENEHRVELLLTDIVLPGGMNGIELAATAKAKHPGLKLLCMSGHAPKSALNERFGTSNIPVVRKPFRAKDLLDFVGRVLKNHATEANSDWH